jgi:hypothetical protein
MVDHLRSGRDFYALLRAHCCDFCPTNEDYAFFYRRVSWRGINARADQRQRFAAFSFFAREQTGTADQQYKYC